MLSSHRHTRIIAAVAAFLLALSSSGFTAVLHSCLMAERSCCDASMMTHMSGDEGATQAGNPVLKNVMSCCAVTFAGGLNANPIVTGNQYSSLHHLDQVALLPPSVLTGAQQISSHPVSASFLAAASPPSVEKYLLNASFLI